MAHLTPKEVYARYSVREYAIRYLDPEARPRTQPEPHAVFALECGPEALVSDPVGAAVLFETEAQAFAYRNRLGILHPVLVFYEAGHAPDTEEYDPKVQGALPDQGLIEAYVAGRED